jgi:outer membrane lipoprotein SlyB
MIKQNNLLVASAAIVAVLLSGCARQISSDVYSDTQMGEASRTYAGVVANVRKVQVAPEKLENNVLGAGAGALGGGLAASHIGGGKGNIAATAAGAIAGAVGGAYAEQMLKTQDALEYVVKLRGGEMRTVVQGPSPAFAVGQPVLVVVAQNGRSRVIADMTGHY